MEVLYDGSVRVGKSPLTRDDFAVQDVNMGRP